MTPPRTLPDDPRLTAYVLGELDADAAAALETEMQTHPELQAECAALAAFCSDLMTDLETETSASASTDGQGQLPPTQRAAILAEAAQQADRVQPGAPARHARQTRWLRIAVGGIAALFVVSLGVLMTLQQTTREDRLSAAPETSKLNVADDKSYHHAPPGQVDSTDMVADSLANPPGADWMNVIFEEGHAEGAKPATTPEPTASLPPVLGNASGTPAPRVHDDLVAEVDRERGGYIPHAATPQTITRIPAPPSPEVTSGSESYQDHGENGWKAVAEAPLSTFSIDVDTASYSNVRRMLTSGQLPPPAAVRVEEMINYFDYAYATPTDGRPFATHVGVTTCPWNPQHRLARVALKGMELEQDQRPTANLVFLLDVSGSMNSANKLPLVKRGMTLLTEGLGPRDRVAIVTYAGNSGLVLDSTSARDQASIINAVNNLRPGGSTNGAAGIELAYRIAQEHFVKGGVNRVILCTDGDFNVGMVNPDALQTLIEQKARSGVFLSVLGFGMGNLKDSTLETLADKGNGNYAYIDTEREAYKVLGEQLSGTLVTIAKDVKIQVEFNPQVVAHYRLIGYENRMLQKEDFNDDTKDAGEIGAGHTVTALYEIALTDAPPARPTVDALRYQPTPAEPAPHQAERRAQPQEMLFVKLRYKQPDSDTSTKVEYPVLDEATAFDRTDADLRFAVAVACFGQKLRGSEHLHGMSYAAIAEIAQSAAAPDPSGYRAEFVQLVRQAERLDRR